MPYIFFVAQDSFKRTLRKLGRTRKAALESMSKSPSAEMAEHALRFTLELLDEPWEVEEFLAGLPAFLDSKFVGQNAPDVVLRYTRGDECRLLGNINVLLLTRYGSDYPLPSTRTIRRLQVSMNAFQSVLDHLMRSPEALLGLEDHSENLAFDYYVAENTREAEVLCYHPDPSVAVVAASTLGRLRNVMMNDLMSGVDGGWKIPFEQSRPISACVRKVVEATSYDAQRPHLPTINFDDLSFQGSSADSDAKLLPLDQEDPLHSLVHQVRRAAYLDNITCYIRHIWNISSSVPKEHHNRIVETAEMLSVSFRAAYAHERGVLWKDGVDDFVALWADIRESYSLMKPNEDTDNALSARLFEVLWPVAALVLPDVPTLDRALAYPLPKQTLFELIRLNNHDTPNEGNPPTPSKSSPPVPDLALYPELSSTPSPSGLKLRNPDGEDERGEAIDAMLVRDIEVVVLPREV
ncbi:hypothetical protein OF83DRAFT_1085807 [Amylostereum chailletii]|nr:hypothetical protein OF83DRAFT_1085807 [Amylostereum chailletii]